LLLVLGTTQTVVPAKESNKGNIPIQMTQDFTLEELQEILERDGYTQLSKSLNKENITIVNSETRSMKKSSSDYEPIGEEETFFIPIKDTESNKMRANAEVPIGGGVFKLQMYRMPSSQSGKGKVKTVLTQVAALGVSADRIDIELSLQNSTTPRTGYKYDTMINTSWKSFNVGKTEEVESSTFKTYYWDDNVEIDVYYNNKKQWTWNSSDYRKDILLNSKGVDYPEYVDPNSGIEMDKPARTDWSKTPVTSACRLTESEKREYRNWYDKTYGKIQWNNPDGSWNYEIHHIRPCFLGGDKSKSNLIPLPTKYHRSVVSPWWTGYLRNDAVDESKDE
jgi:hypothetical protein